MFIGRTFNNYYLVWPMTGAAIAALMAHGRHTMPENAVSSRRCVVVLPGVHYFSQAPLLWFAREAAQAAGWSVLELSERAAADEEPFTGCASKPSAPWPPPRPSRSRSMGKSLGSAAAPLVAERGLPAVWLTPLLIRPDVVARLNAADAPALLVGSPADPTWSDGERPVNDVLEVLELEGLDHSLQVEGDPRPRSRCCAR